MVIRPISGAVRRVIPNIAGVETKWSSDGKFLYYQVDAGISRIPVRTTPTFNTMGDPELILPLANENGWDISSDGNTMVVVTRSVEMQEDLIPEQKIIWYQNWSDYLKREFER